MKLGLSMVVKNEEKRLDSYLKQIHDLFDDLVVIDTGSTDNTIGILEKDIGARVISVRPHREDPYVITDARNISLEENEADWILVLDADEFIRREEILHIKERITDESDAYFLTWRNTRGDIVFDDYKLALFRNCRGIEFEGMVHSNPQRSARRQKIDAPQLDDVVIHHCLNGVTAARSCRKDRLRRYAERYPDWWRYHWFLGYTYFKEGDYDNAVPLLRDTCNALSKDFPVECLNAHMVLTDINARKGIKDKCVRIMRQAEDFLHDVRGDFEVRANRDMEAWIDTAQDHIRNDNLQEVRSYEFAY